MCHQTVGLISQALENAGIVTTSISLLEEVTEKVRTPRALSVPYALGFPLGAAFDVPLQTAIVRQALALLGRSAPPEVLERLILPG